MPTVRLDARRYLSSDPCDVVQRHRSDAIAHSVIDVDGRDGVEVPDLVGDVRDTVGLEHQAGAELVTRALELLGVMPCLRTSPMAACAAASSTAPAARARR